MGERTQYVLGAIGLAFVLFVILRGDLPRYQAILMGARSN